MNKPWEPKWISTSELLAMKFEKPSIEKVNGNYVVTLKKTVIVPEMVYRRNEGQIYRVCNDDWPYSPILLDVESDYPTNVVVIEYLVETKNDTYEYRTLEKDHSCFEESPSWELTAMQILQADKNTNQLKQFIGETI